jgi:carbon-monoxide dehydrogenase medium subunit
VEILSRYEGKAQVIGGGTDLLLDIQQGNHPAVEAMLDPTRIEGLDTIEEEEGFLVIGCGVTHTRIVGDERIIRHGTCLVESCGVIGGPQVRNVATLAGNIAHALPAADGTIGLLALDGEIEVTGADGSRWMPLLEGFRGPGQSAIDPSRSLLSRMRFRPTGALQGSAFRRVMRPQGVALPMLSMAACVQLADEQTIAAARVAIGPAGPIPFLAEKTMELLAGSEPTGETFTRAAEAALGEVHLRSSQHRASSAYREEMIRVQLPKTLRKAVERAQSGTAEPEGVGE